MKHTTKKAILINAKTNTVSFVEVGEYTDIYKHCGYQTFTCVGLPQEKETLYVDDEGLINGTDYGFTIEGYADPLMGNGLILGTRSNGDSRDTDLTVEEVCKMVRILRPTAFGFISMKPTAG
jgi:hypothetical protein